MTFRVPVRPVVALAFVSVLGIVVSSRFFAANAAAPPSPNEPAYTDKIKPFFTKNCMQCHNSETGVAGVRLDQLSSEFEDKHIAMWEGVRHRIANGTMPPKGLPQPSAQERKEISDWIGQALETAKLRPAPKNGLVRRLTVSQYRNTLRELLKLEDDVTTGLPPDAISKDGFVNNQETLQLSPLLLEAYFEIAETALGRAMVDPKSKPSIQNFKMELGAGVNPDPIKEKLILGAGSALLENRDVLITQLIPTKLFAFDPHPMKTKYRFIEGYQGNDTVRGWREYDSIYHVVYADMRGSGGYPKGKAFTTVPEGLLLRPAIPNDEQFGAADGTYGPKANFKISTRELPDNGRFRVTVTAAKYDDGMLLEKDAKQAVGDSVTLDPKTAKSLTVPKAGVYQVDVFPAAGQKAPPAPDATRISEGLLGGAVLTGKLEGRAKLLSSPFGAGTTLAGENASVSVGAVGADAADADGAAGAADFTVAAWIEPQQLRKAGLISFGAAGENQGWSLNLGDRGMLRFDTAGPDQQLNSTVASPTGVLKNKTWQHIAVVVSRTDKAAKLYVNGYGVGKGEIGPENLTSAKATLQLGRSFDGQQYRGDLADARVYKRALAEAEIQALVEPGKKYVLAPPGERPQDVTITLGERQFVDEWRQPAFMAVRLNAGETSLRIQHSGIKEFDKVVFTPLADDSALLKRFAAFEKRAPKLGVHIGFRRDCGSTFAPVGSAKPVSDGKLTKYVFEGAMRNYPNPDVEKDNVNYLAGVREIAVRSEYTDGRDMPRLVVRTVEFEGPYYDTWPPVSHKSIFVDSPRKSDSAAYAKEVVTGFATRAYRRPVTATEVASLMSVYTNASASGRTFQESIKDALQVVLTSPQFLFLVETSQTPAPEPLNGYELASKLSYFLWNGPPDKATMRLAANGTLRKQLDAEVARLTADAKFSQFTREFTTQWLALDKFAVLEPDRKKFPTLTQDTRAQLKKEPIQFVDHLLRNNLPVKNLVSSDFVMMNETVAGYYGLGDKTESGFDFVPIHAGRKELGGVLTEAAIMAGLSDGRESNPVKRGSWLARRIIAEPPADPPPNVPALKEETKNLTLRQRLEQHRSQPACAQCHSKIDPWGVALEEFDAGGRLKTVAADAHSTLPDKTEVNGIADLQKYLAQDRIDQVAFSFMKHLATYGTGRTLSYSEISHLKQDALLLKADGYRTKDMIRYVVNSKMFLEK